MPVSDEEIDNEWDDELPVCWRSQLAGRADLPVVGTRARLGHRLGRIRGGTAG
jgi:hypothetical protein